MDTQWIFWISLLYIENIWANKYNVTYAGLSVNFIEYCVLSIFNCSVIYSKIYSIVKNMMLNLDTSMQHFFILNHSNRIEILPINRTPFLIWNYFFSHRKMHTFCFRQLIKLNRLLFMKSVRTFLITKNVLLVYFAYLLAICFVNNF